MQQAQCLSSTDSNSLSLSTPLSPQLSCSLLEGFFFLLSSGELSLFFLLLLLLVLQGQVQKKYFLLQLPADSMQHCRGGRASFQTFGRVCRVIKTKFCLYTPLSSFLLLFLQKCFFLKTNFFKLASFFLISRRTIKSSLCWVITAKPLQVETPSAQTLLTFQIQTNFKTTLAQ